MTERAKKIQDGKRERALLALKERYRKSQEGGRDELIFITPGEAMTLIKALQELKEQEPRVMMLEEVKGMKRLTICAVEQRSKVIKNTFNAEYWGIVTIGTENFLDFGLYGDINRYRRTEAGYGKTWRCWTSRPTDGQREEVKWDEI